MKIFLKKIWEGWKKVAIVIGRVNTVIIMTVFYFLIIAPIGLIFRLFGWDPLQVRKKQRLKGSNWKKIADSEPDIETMSRQS